MNRTQARGVHGGSPITRVITGRPATTRRRTTLRRLPTWWRAPSGRRGPTPRRQAGKAGRGERGSASVWVLAIGVAVLTFGVFGASIGAAIVARHRAQAAADLGALAAAVHALEGRGAACDRAAAVVSANAARMVSCTVTGLEAVVTAEADAAGLAAALRPARASARAGPAV